MIGDRGCCCTNNTADIFDLWTETEQHTLLCQVTTCKYFFFCAFLLDNYTKTRFMIFQSYVESNFLLQLNANMTFI